MNIGDQLGNYCIIRHIGHGGFADVYLAEHNYIKGKRVAIKVLRAALTGQDRDVFKVEAQRLHDLKHPNIVPLIDFAVEPQTGTPFLTMEYAENGSLRSKHPPKVPLPTETILHYVRQVSSALQCIHEHGLIHRDIKPANMLLGPNDVVWLSDIGIAVELPSQTLTPRGTPAYMSPEQTQGKPCPASDQYALGVVVYEWLCGERPFDGSNPFHIARQHEQKLPPSLRGRIPHLSSAVISAVEIVVFIALAKKPEERFASMKAFATAFEQALTKTESLVQFPSSAPSSSDGPANTPLPPPSMKDKEVIALSQIRTSHLVDKVDGQANTNSKVLEKLRGKKIPMAALVLCVLLPIFLVLAAGYGILSYIHPDLWPFASSSAHVIITPESNDLQNHYLLTGVTGIPDPNKMQIAAHKLTRVMSGSQQKTAPTTGHANIRAISAAGTITFDQGSGSAKSIPAGTLFFSNVGYETLKVVTDQDAYLSAGNSTVTASAHVIQAGAAGNAVSINQACCNPPDNTIHATSGPFSGGADAYDYNFVQQSDIDSAVNALTRLALQAAPQEFQKQVNPNEALVDPPDCSKTMIDSDHNAGDKANTVKVTVTAICNGETYDHQGALDMATSLLKQDAKSSLGTGYVPMGQVQPIINSVLITDPTNGQLSLQVSVHGTWMYQFSRQQLDSMRELIEGKTKAEATTLLLLQSGVKGANIQITRSDGNTLPTDLSGITITIASTPISQAPSKLQGADFQI